MRSNKSVQLGDYGINRLHGGAAGRKSYGSTRAFNLVADEQRIFTDRGLKGFTGKIPSIYEFFTC
ncbi:hypothetical protein D3C86_1946440 [compost metagenome]